LSGERRKLCGIEGKFTFGGVHVHIVGDSDITRRRRENIGKPAPLEKPIPASIIQCGIPTGHHVTTKE
jgi:hypothetical protein